MVESDDDNHDVMRDHIDTVSQDDVNSHAESESVDYSHNNNNNNNIDLLLSQQQSPILSSDSNNKNKKNEFISTIPEYAQLRPRILLEVLSRCVFPTTLLVVILFY